MNLAKMRTTGYLEVIIAACIWGSNGVIVNVIPMSSYVIAFFRVFFATLGVLFGILLYRRTELLKVTYSLKKLISLGILLCLGWGFLFEAMKLLPIAEAVLLNYMAPIFVTILALIFFKEKIVKRTVTSLVLSMIGIILIVFSKNGFEWGNLSGIIIGLSAGLAYAIFLVLSKDALRSLPNYTLVLYSAFFASVILAPSLITVRLTLPWNFWLMLIILGVVNTAFAVSLFFRGLKKIKAQEAAILCYLEPVSAAFFGFFFLGQTLTPIAVIGGGLVILGGYIITSR